MSWSSLEFRIHNTGIVAWNLVWRQGTAAGSEALVHELMITVFIGAKISSSLQARPQKCEKRLLASSCISVSPSIRPSVCPPALKKSPPTERIFVKYNVSGRKRKSLQKIQVWLNLTRLTVLHMKTHPGCCVVLSPTYFPKYFVW